MKNRASVAADYVRNIREAKLSIYDQIEVGDPALWIPSPALEQLLDSGLKGMALTGLPLRTRSKVVKAKVCEILGYPTPSTFKKCQPRFYGQQFDTYIQKSNNLQIWNEELSPTRRYALIRVSEADKICKIKVVDGDTLAKLDTTGTLTQKYQARLVPSDETAELIVEKDTDRLSPFVSDGARLNVGGINPSSNPEHGQLLPIRTIFERLKNLIGKNFVDSGYDQERNRGGQLHRLVCAALGYTDYRDDGRFPDIRNQLLEVKLQTSPTIDLGLVCPNSEDPLDIPKLSNAQLQHCDVRYVLFYAVTDGKSVRLTNLYVTTGQSFFERFPQFQGKVLNKKLQIPLPKDFFNEIIC